MQGDDVPVDEVTRHALAAMETTRTTGAPFLACLMGVVPVQDTPATVELRLDAAVAALGAGVGLLDVAMLADLAIGAALRSSRGLDRVTPTVTLTLHLDAVPAARDVSVRAWDTDSSSEVVGSRADVVSGGRVVGQALAVFAIPGSAARSAPMPWETGGTPRTPRHASVGRALQHLTVEEREVVEAVEQAALGSTQGGPSWTEQLLARACTVPAHEGDAAATGAVTRLHPTLAMRNRAGAVQGAVLFALSATVATAAVAPARVRVLSLHMDFVSAADAAVPVDAEPTLVRTTRRLSFLRVEVRQGGRTVATAGVVLARGSSDG